ncbi:hypothetical protein A2U01_0114835, partial [Trifolium medium]|nr:hypothetical protein [Trifolium medium]
PPARRAACSGAARSAGCQGRLTFGVVYAARSVLVQG